MDRETNEVVDLIDLGAASVETQGFDDGVLDGAGLQIKTGLSED